MKNILSLVAAMLFACSGYAQTPAEQPGTASDTVAARKPRGNQLTIGGGQGIYIGKAKDESKRHFVDVQFGMLDLGINTIHDNTDYSSAAARRFLHVDDAYANKDLFALRNGKSVNVNIYPVMVKANLVHAKRQKLILSTGLGLQLYNFRFNKPVSYRNDPQPYVTLDTIAFTKNKLAFNYLMVPLMLTSKTRISKHGDSGKGIWVVYGAGVSAGYRLSSWTKQVSGERGKDKNHDPFNFSDTNLCVNGEIGLDGFFRLFASYQLTALQENGLDQHPMSIGIRFLGL